MPIAGPSSTSGVGDSVPALSVPDGRTREPGLAILEAGSAGFTGPALLTVGNIVDGSFWKTRYPAGEGGAGVVDEHALKRCYLGLLPVR